VIAETETVKIAIVDEHPLFREALAATVRRQSDMEVVQAVGLPRHLQRLDNAACDVVVIDPQRSDGADDVILVLAESGYRVLVVSAAEAATDVLAALDAGAAGYIGKDAEADQLIWAIRRVAEGEIYLAPRLSSALVSERRRTRQGTPQPEFTEREREVLLRLAAGCTDQEIARQLMIKVSTVRSHLDHVRDKAGLRRRAELALYAVRHGIYDPACNGVITPAIPRDLAG
jgi:DNA-binding NarL/FixJ family response regulator